MINDMKKTIAVASLAVGFAVLSGCTQTPEPVPVPVVQTPQRPYPPMGAAPNLTIPPRGVDGSRLTINSGLSAKQAAWNLRSAYNVAALNCQDMEHAAIVANYGDFLKSHSRVLSSINSDLDKEYKRLYGSRYIRERESFQTQVYNYFALPPVVPAFCDTALAVGQELRAVPAEELETYAFTALSKFESVYQDFFNAYDQYRRDLAAWEATYSGASWNTASADASSVSGVEQSSSQ